MLFAWHWATYRDQYLTRHPDSLSYPQYKFCTMTIFCLKSNLYRDTAPVPFSKFIYRDKYSSIYQHCTAIAPKSDKNCTMIAKSTPYLSCHRDYFLAKVPGYVAGWLHQVTQPTLYCRAVRQHTQQILPNIMITILYKSECNLYRHIPYPILFKND